MKLELSLTQREADAIMRAEFSTGWGVRKSQALSTAEFKLRAAIIAAESANREGKA